MTSDKLTRDRQQDVMGRRKFSRRAFVSALAFSPVLSHVGLAGPNQAPRAASSTPHGPAGIFIDDVSYGFEEFRYRAPYRFGGREADRVTILNVNCVAHTASGRSAKGFGSMTLGNLW